MQACASGLGEHQLFELVAARLRPVGPYAAAGWLSTDLPDTSGRRPRLQPDEAAFVSSLCEHIANGLRTAMHGTCLRTREQFLPELEAKPISGA